MILSKCLPFVAVSILETDPKTVLNFYSDAKFLGLFEAYYLLVEEKWLMIRNKKILDWGRLLGFDMIISTLKCNKKILQLLIIQVIKYEALILNFLEICSAYVLSIQHYVSYSFSLSKLEDDLVKGFLIYTHIY